MVRPTAALVLALAAACAGAACGDDPVTAPTPEAPVEVTESFSGTLTINGARTHPFAVQRAGTVTATLGTLAPDSAAVIGLSLGTWNGATCAVLLANDAATSSTSVVGTASVGNFCVRVYDVGRLDAPADYSISVRHF